MPEYPRKFTHKGEDHMSFKGYFVTAKTYYYHSHNNVPAEAIFMEHGTAFEELVKQKDKDIDRWHRSFPEIRSMQ